MHELVLKLGLTLSVLVESNKLFEEEIIIGEQGEIRFKKHLRPFSRDTIKMRDNEKDARFIIMFLEDNKLHADIQIALLEKRRKLRSLSIKSERFFHFGFFKWNHR